MPERFDIIIIGAGPGGIFAALEMKQLSREASVLLIDQGRKVEKRYCPIEKVGSCVRCKPFCHITNGFAGAGAFSDGKLSLFNENDDDIHVGGDLHKYIGVEKTKELIKYVDSLYLEFGADSRLEGTEYKEEIQRIADKAKEYNIRLVSIPIRHLGTDRSRDIYLNIQNRLNELGVEVLMETTVTDLIIEDGHIKGVSAVPALDMDREGAQAREFYSDNVVISVGRKGAKWMFDMCARHDIKNKSGVVDIGVRYELPNATMEKINKYMYEGKFIGYPEPFKDKVRTFCQNPSGFVSAEVYDSGITIVNGHSYKDKKSENTNLALLVSHEFKYPFNQPIKFGRNIAMNTNDLGAGNILVQRFGDILAGRRSWEHDLKNNHVRPTLAAAAGDITSALPYRTMTDIINFILNLNHVIPGFSDPSNLLYAPEIKFYSNQIVLNNRLETNISGLYCIGDTGGLTHGLMMASCSGVQVARNINEHLQRRK